MRPCESSAKYLAGRVKLLWPISAAVLRFTETFHPSADRCPVTGRPSTDTVLRGGHASGPAIPHPASILRCKARGAREVSGSTKSD